MEVTIHHMGGVRFEGSTRGHHIVSDQPVDNGGQDLGMTPPELMLASLGTCAGFYAAQYLRARALPAANLSVRVTAEKATGQARLGSFMIEVTAPPLEQKHEEGLLRAVKSCLIHATLVHAPKIEVCLKSAERTADPIGADLFPAIQ